MTVGLVGGEGFAVDASQVVADAHRQRGVDKADQLDPNANRAVAEYFAALDDAAFGAASPVEPKFISPVDPAARWTASWGRSGSLSVLQQLSHRCVEHAVIIDVEASTAVRQAEVTAVRQAEVTAALALEAEKVADDVVDLTATKYEVRHRLMWGPQEHTESVSGGRWLRRNCREVRSGGIACRRTRRHLMTFRAPPLRQRTTSAGVRASLSKAETYNSDDEG